MAAENGTSKRHEAAGGAISYLWRQRQRIVAA